MLSGMLLGILFLKDESAHLYGITVVYLVTISDSFQWILRQIVLVESLMISAVRILQFENFEQEKELRVEYDGDVGLTEELEVAE